MRSVRLRHVQASLLGIGALALAVSAASAAPLVKECSKNGKFIIGFSQASSNAAHRNTMTSRNGTRD